MVLSKLNRNGDQNCFQNGFNFGAIRRSRATGPANLLVCAGYLDVKISQFDSIVMSLSLVELTL